MFITLVQTLEYKDALAYNTDEILGEGMKME